MPLICPWQGPLQMFKVAIFLKGQELVVGCFSKRFFFLHSNSCCDMGWLLFFLSLVYTVNIPYFSERQMVLNIKQSPTYTVLLIVPICNLYTDLSIHLGFFTAYLGVRETVSLWGRKGTMTDFEYDTTFWQTSRLVNIL